MSLRIKQKTTIDSPPFNRLKPEVRRVFLFVGLFSFFINVLMLTTPIYMLQIYDRVLASGSVPTLLFLTIAVVGLTLSGSLLENTRTRIMVRLGKSLDLELTDNLFSELFSQKKEASATKNTAPLQDLSTLRNFLSGSGLINLFDAPWTPIYLCVIFLFSPILGLIATFGAIALFTVAVLSDMFTRKGFTDASKSTNFAQRFADHAVLYSTTVESMGMVEGLKQKWLTIHSKGLSQHVKASQCAGILSSLAKFIRPCLQISILGTGAYLALNGSITPGVMIATSIIMSRALSPVEGAINNWRHIILARSAYERLKAVLSGINEQSDAIPLPRPSGKLNVERLVAPIPGSSVPIIKGISFFAAAGDVIGIIGPSGAGKSTLAKLMVGAWRPSSGNIRLDGADIADWHHQSLGKYLGYLPQEVALFDGTIAENICRFSKADPEGVIKAASRADIHDLILRLPDGYETIVGHSGMALSGGQRQRIGLARALYGDPSLIVLDEPNSNLDGAGEQALLNTLIQLRESKVTTIIIAHRPSIVSMVNKILVLRDGMIESYGSPKDVLPKVSPVKKNVASDSEVENG